MSAVMDHVLTYLASDEDAHPVNELAEALGIPWTTCDRIVRFLVTYHFAQWEGQGVKLDPQIRTFIQATAQKPRLPVTLTP